MATSIVDRFASYIMKIQCQHCGTEVYPDEDDARDTVTYWIEREDIHTIDDLRGRAERVLGIPRPVVRQPEQLEPLDLHRHGEDVGLDMSQFDACMESHRYESTVTEDMAGGHRLGISATPAVFVRASAASGRRSWSSSRRSRCRLDRRASGA